MDVPLPLQRPLSCTSVSNGRTHLKIKRFLGFVPHGTTSLSLQSSSWRNDGMVAGVSFPFCASAGFSRRRRRKISSPRSQGSSPKGFVPRKPSGMSTQRKDQKSNGDKESQSTSSSKESEISNRKTIEAEVETSDDDTKGVGMDLKFLEDDNEISGSTKSISQLPVTQFVESEETGDDDKDTVKLIKPIRMEESDFLIDSVIREQSGGDYSENSQGETNASSKGSRAVGTKLSEILQVDPDELNEPQKLKENNAVYVEYKGPRASELLEMTKPNDVERIGDLDSSSFLKSDSVEEGDPLTAGTLETEDTSVNLRLEMEGPGASELLEMAKPNDVEHIGDLDSSSFLKSDSVEEGDPLTAGTLETEDTSVNLRLEMEGPGASELLEMAKPNDVEHIGDLDSSSFLKSDSVEEGDPLTAGTLETEDTSVNLRLEMEGPGASELLEMAKPNDVEHIGDLDSSSFLKSDSVEEGDPLTAGTLETEDTSLNLRLEMEANLRRQATERLAEEKLLQGIRLFCFPEVVKPDEDVEIFLNRSLSALNNEPDVLIMGAFNDWRWRSFTTRLTETHLNRDWWSCKIHVPKEAYKIDFVFFNGQDVYDNNDGNDFSITVEGGMQIIDFENFLLEEKWREQEKLAKEQAERERLAEEQRRIEAEKAAIEADRAQAKEEAAKKREVLQALMAKASKIRDVTWYIEPSEFKCEDKVRICYNKSSGPLSHAKDLWIHGGHNNWKGGLSIVEKLVKSERIDGDWWYAEVFIPDRALVLDWVFADGPPKDAIAYDNNHRQDFHAIVPKHTPEELYWVEEEHQIFKTLQEERRLREVAMRAKAEKTALLKAETKERTMKSFLLSQKHIVYTEPLDIQAGSSVTVYYNPANTVLNGKLEIWFRCSFNRWTHRLGPLPPQKMLPAENGTHVKATVKVPLDAYMMDFVFSEREDGGIFDNKSGMDYHIPVFGGVTKEPPMHIVHIAVEMAPIAKVGGLGDVVTSLSRAVQDLNHNVDIVLPKYDCLKMNHVKDFQFHKSFFWGGTEIKVWFGKVEGLSVYFLEPQNGFFGKGRVYGCNNDGERFGFFCHTALEFLLQGGFHPDIIHCHDWSSAPVAWLFKEQYTQYGLSKSRIVFTIHNLEFGANLIGKAMTFADKATTVSPTYSQEVSGNPVIAPHLYKFHGIVNGIDPDIWDPLNDKFLPISYTSENVVEGKAAAKKALQQKLGLKQADLPLVGIITRLTHQKGIHLIKHAIWRTLERNGQVVLLGSAPDPRIQNDFVNLANELHSKYNDRARLCLTYDEPLSHLIYSGADFILVPSIFEPCGLTQLTAMRYGSIPVVRKTGGAYI
ncbi:soluble starch synthase 3, chloroplastic/amyloplastic isoform X3 [Lycium barbarum]|uniref:soluble starch synthase 3, chloroplastic/amyloplastic isoform X3 n=1 Tax=Lycium barbarum TaxID=112863 RepID=UPI00293F129B|nr:soluble starch synthase 3, chloroplastic/amyloplastic isoform X3 [Lycium barbarum]